MKLKDALQALRDKERAESKQKDNSMRIWIKGKYYRKKVQKF